MLLLRLAIFRTDPLLQPIRHATPEGVRVPAARRTIYALITVSASKQKAIL